jgi:hypothetical protein
VAGLRGPQTPEFIELLDREYGNVRAELRWACDHGEAELALDLAARMGPFWVKRGHLTEGRRWLRETLAMQALISSAWLAIDQTDLDDALAHCDRAMELAERFGSDRAAVAVLSARGIVAHWRSRFAEATGHFEAALAIAERTDDPYTGSVLGNMASVALSA